MGYKTLTRELVKLYEAPGSGCITDDVPYGISLFYNVYSNERPEPLETPGCPEYLLEVFAYFINDIIKKLLTHQVTGTYVPSNPIDRDMTRTDKERYEAEEKNNVKLRILGLAEQTKEKPKAYAKARGVVVPGGSSTSQEPEYYLYYRKEDGTINIRYPYTRMYHSDHVRLQNALIDIGIKLDGFLFHFDKTPIDGRIPASKVITDFQCPDLHYVLKSTNKEFVPKAKNDFDPVQTLYPCLIYNLPTPDTVVDIYKCEHDFGRPAYPCIRVAVTEKLDYILEWYRYKMVTLLTDPVGNLKWCKETMAIVETIVTKKIKDDKKVADMAAMKAKYL